MHDLSLSALLIELRKVISSPKGANVWLEVQVDGLDWYAIIKFRTLLHLGRLLHLGLQQPPGHFELSHRNLELLL